jgi:hypothetical protein
MTREICPKRQNRCTFSYLEDLTKLGLPVVSGAAGGLGWHGRASRKFPENHNEGHLTDSGRILALSPLSDSTPDATDDLRALPRAIQRTVALR